MVSRVAARKRKDDNTPASQDKGKIRIIENSRDGNPDAFTKFPRLKPSLANPLVLSGLRRGSVKILSVFRSGKSISGSPESAAGNVNMIKAPHQVRHPALARP